jgi:DegV family protein with EDD domain
MINIIADSLCGIPASLRPKLGIPFISQFIIIDGKPYRDTSEIDTATFLLKLKSSKELPKTGAPLPEDYIPLFRKLAGKGDTAIVITPSKDMSGTYNAAWVAKQEFPAADIRLVDTRTIAGGLGSIVLQSLFWVRAGWDADRIMKGISSMAERERLFFLVDTLEYMQKGGRIGGAAALIGTFLQIKPILTLHDGQVEVYEKIRTKNAALDRIKELVKLSCPRTPDAWLSVSHCSALETATELANSFKQDYGFKYIPVYEVPPAIVVNSGPNILGVSFFVEE